MSSRTFESLRVWQDARRLTRRIYSLCGEGSLNRDFGLRDQMQRAAVSVLSNIAEGYERGGDKELARFLRIARGSAAEIRAQFYIAEDAGHIDAAMAMELRARATIISRQLTRLLARVSRSQSS